MDKFNPNSLEEVLSDLEKSDKTDNKETNVPPEGHLVVDIYQNDEEIVVQAAIAGVNGEHLEIATAKDAITIKGRREKMAQVGSADYLHQELHWGGFSRSVILPTDIDVDRARASIKNGLLTIRLPKLVKKI